MSDVQLTDNSDKVLRELEKCMKNAATMIGGTVEGYAKELCPVDTGLLRNSITYALSGQAPHIGTYKSNDTDKNHRTITKAQGEYVDTAPQTENDSQIAVYVGSNVIYAPYQELGAPNIGLDARPFLRPAFENHTDEIEEIIEKCFKDMN